MFDVERPHAYSIFTHSVGANVAGHSLLDKLDAISAAGFNGIEMYQDDLDAFARSDEFRRILATQSHSAMTPPDSPRTSDRKLAAESYRAVDRPASLNAVLPMDDLYAFEENGGNLIGSDGLRMTYNAHGLCTASERGLELAAAHHLRSYCASLGLAIYSLQPLRDFEGWVRADDRQLALKRARSRFEVMKALGTDLLLICSNNRPSPMTTGDVDAIGRDLAELADLAERFGSIPFSDGSRRPIRIGFEALSWGAHVDLWSQAWSAVQAADRANVGLILDSFNTLGRQYADPCSPTGIVQDCDAYSDLMASLERFGEVPADKVFFVQIGDARRMERPLLPSPSADEPRPARMIWSRGNRLFPCEEKLGAFLPVREFMVAAIRGAGYRGPWSVEVFNSSLGEKGREVPTAHARRARDGLDRLVQVVYQ